MEITQQKSRHLEKGFCNCDQGSRTRGGGACSSSASEGGSNLGGACRLHRSRLSWWFSNNGCGLLTGWSMFWWAPKRDGERTRPSRSYDPVLEDWTCWTSRRRPGPGADRHFLKHFGSSPTRLLPWFCRTAHGKHLNGPPPSRFFNCLNKGFHSFSEPRAAAAFLIRCWYFWGGCRVDRDVCLLVMWSCRHVCLPLWLQMISSCLQTKVTSVHFHRLHQTFLPIYS